MYKFISIDVNGYDPNISKIEYETALNDLENQGYALVNMGVNQNRYGESVSYWAMMHKQKEHIPLGITKFDIPKDILS